jgi:hypothetical protein
MARTGIFDVVTPILAAAGKRNRTGWGILVGIARHSQTKRAHEPISRKAEAAIKQHLPTLVTKRAQLVRQDAYGKWLLDDWRKEIQYFIAQHIKPLLTREEQWGFAASLQSEIANMIYSRVEWESVKSTASRTFSDDIAPDEFETFCADELRRVGWNARVTMQSRDQGVDVVAEKNGVRVALQCKLYALPVGNKAVQEIAAARTHEQADYGVVVSNNRYTQDAERLASTNKIFLLHHTDLCRLEDIIDLKKN